MIGTTLSHFRITAKLGEGGMGVVYRAEDTRLGREVAIKVLPEDFTADPERLARFEREAKVLATLNHPNIAAIYDVGEAGTAPYLVMELVDGDTLDKLIPQNGLELSRFFELATALADALAAAHDKGVTHRDLKPANVMVTSEGRLKVLDFGLAKLRPIGGDDERTRTQPDSVTAEGRIVGTVAYMSPEQAEGKPIDHRSDIFSLGVVLYQMATGRRPFTGDSTLSTLSAILRDSPRLVTELRQDLPRHLGRIITHCLQKDPQRRYQSARDITNELLELGREAASGELSETRLPPHRRATSLARVVAAAAVIVVGAALFFWLRPPAAPDPLPTLGLATRVTTGDVLATHGAISPDGSLVAFAAGQATKMRVYIQPVGGGRTITLSEDSTAFEYQPRWSPDGTQILYLTPEGARVSSSLGGTSRLVAGPSDEVGPFSAATGGIAHPVSATAWAPDGKRVFIGRGGALSIVPLDGGAELRLGVLPYEVHSCDWSPLGRWVACTSGNWESVVPGHNFANLAPSSIILIDSDDGTTRLLTDRTSLNQSPVWSADGRRLYYVSNAQGPRDVYALDIGRDGGPSGEPRRMTTGLGAISIALSGDGKRLIYVEFSEQSNIWSLSIPTSAVSASTATALTSGDQIVEGVAVSPDGHWLVYDSNLFGNSDIFRIPVEGGTPERLIEHPADDFVAKLSPDGSAIVFHSWRTGSRDIFVQPLGGQPQQVTDTDSQESYPTWSPDGTALLYWDQLVVDGVELGLHLVESDNAGGWSEPVLVRPGTGHGFWMADGSIIYAILESGSIEIRPAKDGAVRTIYEPRPGSDDPRAGNIVIPSEDGRFIYFKTHTADGSAAIWSVPMSGGTPRLLVYFDDPDRPSIRPDFGAGAGRFFFTLEDRRSVVWVVELGEG